MVKFCLYTVCLSPHQIPLAKELVNMIGADNYRYVYTEKIEAGRSKLGWGVEDAEWIMFERDAPELCRTVLEMCDVLISGLRDLELFRKRSANGKKTIYCAERWFKPLSIGVGSGCRCSVDGRVRMLIPRYRKMAQKIVQLAKTDPNFMLYPMGIHAARDFAWLLGCKITDFEHVPGGRFFGSGKYLDRMRLWGYFVAPSTAKRATNNQLLTTAHARRVLWVGRFLDWKRVGDLINAARISRVALALYGVGPEERRLKKMSRGVDDVVFHGSVPISSVRALMREHDVYVLSSDAYEGWGAVVNEALEEGMKVIGTWEAGSSATILPKECLYHAGDYRRLAALLASGLPCVEIGPWSAKMAAQTLCDEMLGGGHET